MSVMAIDSCCGDTELHSWMDERDAMRAWLKRHCPLKIEYDFWYYFYDDLDDCFDDIEPWRFYSDTWREWDREFTGRRIRL